MKSKYAIKNTNCRSQYTLLFVKIVSDIQRKEEEERRGRSIDDNMCNEAGIC